jgi:DNA-binding MurR/RpiR family transcriptional regulator
VQLARPVAAIGELLVGVEGVGDLIVEDQRIVFSYSRESGDAADLLKQLVVRLGLPVASFRANDLDLEEAYMRAGIGQVD